jgi:hypothetical protein
MSTDRKSLLYLIIIMCFLWIASLVVVLKVPRETAGQENHVFPVVSPTVYKPPTPTNTRVLLMLELTPGKIEVIEVLPTLPPDPNFTPVPGVTSNVPQISAPVDMEELDVYKQMQK